MPIKPSSKWNKQYITEKDELESIKSNLINKGEKILSLTVGDPPAWGFGNQPLSTHLYKAAEDGWHTYGGKTNDQGLYANPSLTQRLQIAIAEFEKRERDVDYNSNNIFPCGGSGSALTCLHYSILDDGDEILVLEPSHYLGGPTSYLSYFNAKTVQSRMIDERNGILI
jgi:aspartate/methionine/tyrosine aminotransferase